MTTYLVTTELKTPWWLKLLRFFRIKSKRKDFYLTLENSIFENNDILTVGLFGSQVKIVERIRR